MDKEKISKFILELRKEKQMTQQQLADLLFISDKAISKWERGINLPDVTILEKIAKIFNVSIAELIKGEKFNNDDSIDKYNEVIIDSMEFENHKNKTNKHRLIIMVIVINLIILSILFSFFIKNYNNVVAYNFTGWSENFSFHLGNVIYSKNYHNSIIISAFQLSEETNINLDEIKDIKISVMFDNQNWQSAWYYSPNDSKNINIKDWVKGITFSDTHFNKNCGKYELNGEVFYANCTSFELSNKNKFPNNMQIEVDYCYFNGECFRENLSVKTEMIVKNTIF